MIGERAYSYGFEGEPREHLWFVLSEPDEPLLAVCLSLISFDPVGRTLCVFRNNEVLTDADGARHRYVTTKVCTIAIPLTRALTRAEAARRFTPERCHGTIRGPILRRLRRAVCDGSDTIRDEATRAEVLRVCSAWFPPDESEN